MGVCLINCLLTRNFILLPTGGGHYALLLHLPAQHIAVGHLRCSDRFRCHLPEGLLHPAVEGHSEAGRGQQTENGCLTRDVDSLRIQRTDFLAQPFIVLIVTHGRCHFQSPNRSCSDSPKIVQFCFHSSKLNVYLYPNHKRRRLVNVLK